MTTLELKLILPDELVREAKAAGLLTPDAVTSLLKEAMRTRAALALLEGAERASSKGRKPMPMEDIQKEVDAVRRARRASRRAARRS